jgi:hypothetical protein
MAHGFTRDIRAIQHLVEYLALDTYINFNNYQ